MVHYYSEEVRSTVLAYMEGASEPSLNQVEQLEHEFAEFMGMENCVAVSSGSSALHCALIASGVKPGDEVITIANSCTAVSNFIIWCGATPVFVDVEPETYNMNPELVEAAITSKTKAIIPVHLYGLPADMAPILEIAERKSLLVIEDAAQALGATYKGKKVGTMGTVGTFSFIKNLGGFGGAILTNDEKISYKAKMLRYFGLRPGKSGVQEILGYRYTLSELDAVIDRVQLKSLDANNEKRRQNAQKYDKMLQDVSGIVLPTEKSYGTHVYWNFVPRAQMRNELVNFANERGVNIRRSYSIPVYEQGAYKDFEYNRDMFPITERNAKEAIRLPIYPELKTEELKRISETMHTFYQ